MEILLNIVQACVCACRINLDNFKITDYSSLYSAAAIGGRGRVSKFKHIAVKRGEFRQI